LTREEKAAKKDVFPLMDLPPELLLHIFEQLLIMPDAIEFCNPGHDSWSYYNGRFHKPEGDEDPFEGSPSTRSSWPNGLSSVSSIMRVNRQFYADTAPIFYGKNEFRFTNDTGWVALDLFLQVGLEKAGMLRKLTVCHPSLAALPCSHRNEDYFWPAVRKLRMERYGKEGGFIYYLRWWLEGMRVDPTW
jgi:hypothetical protein